MRVKRVRDRLRGGPAPPRAFPTPAEQQLSQPECLQSATAVALEQGRGAVRLWVLDSGETPTQALASGSGAAKARFPPKVVVYNLRPRASRAWMRPFDGVPSSAVSGLAVDPGAQDTRAYVGYPEAPGGAALIVLSLKNKAFWHVRLQGMSPPPPQPQHAEAETAQATGRRRGRGGRRRLPRQAPRSGRSAPTHWDVAVLRGATKRPRMVLTPRGSPHIYDVALDALRGAAPDANHRDDALVPAAELGARRLVSKPVPSSWSSGLLADPEGGLLFFQASRAPGACTGAVMRWDPRRGAGPYGYAVLHRDNVSLPLTSAIFLDGQGAAWAACTTFAEHHGCDTAIHHAYEDEEEEEEVVEDDDRKYRAMYPDDDGRYPAEYPDDEDDDDVDSQDDDDDEHDHVNLETKHADDVGHVNDLPPVFRRGSSCRFPRAVGWRVRDVADRGERRAKAGAGGQGEHAEPQEYVCMSSKTRPPSQRAAAGNSGDPNTIMITRRAGHNGGRRLGGGTVLVHQDADAHADGRRIAAVTHCVRLHWDELHEPEQ
ncbi:Protein yellow [Frankliniella fusca]|uniref:Protein yellow n=1 Tax=Frankliniella fusca TaxID=407009 RepID=A0AAE1L9T2_9NEOP|nr:Protein yellow [Frankliniella fusca]